jgi:hypothetical protein
MYVDASLHVCATAYLPSVYVLIVEVIPTSEKLCLPCVIAQFVVKVKDG